MSPTLDPQLKRALADRIRYYNELGIFDFYRRDFYRREIAVQIQPEEREPLPRAKTAVATTTVELVEVSSQPEFGLADPGQGLRAIREDIGDCTRCRLAKQGRKNRLRCKQSRAERCLREALGADEDQQGEPSSAAPDNTQQHDQAGPRREDIYIANITAPRRATAPDATNVTLARRS
jgi:DNA polymerase